MDELGRVTPRGHLAATLELCDRLEELAGRHPDAAAMRALLDRPDDLPAGVDVHDSLLKYDVYLACTNRPAWGVTVNDRWDPSLPGKVDELARAWGYELSTYRALRGRLHGASPALCVSVGFAAGQPARLKLYLQEDRWGEGVATRAELDRTLGELCPSLVLPAWIEAGRTIGVVTVQPTGSEAVSLKIYLGGETALDAARGAPDEALALARDMHDACPLEQAYYYLTVRVDPGAAARYAINKIYNAVAILRDGDPPAGDAAWADVAALFHRAGRGPELTRLRAGLDNPRLWILPTATALEDGSTSCDVYCAAWPRAPLPSPPPRGGREPGG